MNIVFIYFIIERASSIKNMSSGCKIALFCVFIALSFLYQLLIPMFVVPIKGQCSYNDVIPPDARINLSMSDWSLGGMWAAIIIFVLFCSSGKTKTESDCAMLCLSALFFLYQLFDLIWNIIGIIIYNDFYEQACRQADGYSTTMNLAFYSGIVVSSMILLSIGIFICVLCRQAEQEAREPLIQQPQVPPSQNQNIQERQRVKIEPQEERRDEILSDAQVQRQQNIYARLFDKVARIN